jgi:hypothetical protein
MSNKNFQDITRKSIGAIGLMTLWFGVFFIPIVEFTTCTQGSEDAWLISFLLYSPVTILAIAFALVGSSSPAGIRWLTLPPLILLPWASYVAIHYTSAVTVQGNHLCVVSTGESGFNGYPQSWWAAYWGPAQLLIVALVAFVASRYWRTKSTTNEQLNKESGADAPPPVNRVLDSKRYHG